MIYSSMKVSIIVQSMDFRASSSKPKSFNLHVLYVQVNTEFQFNLEFSQLVTLT